MKISFKFNIFFRFLFYFLFKGLEGKGLEVFLYFKIFLFFKDCFYLESRVLGGIVGIYINIFLNLVKKKKKRKGCFLYVKFLVI